MKVRITYRTARDSFSATVDNFDRAKFTKEVLGARFVTVTDKTNGLKSEFTLNLDHVVSIGYEPLDEASS